MTSRRPAAPAGVSRQHRTREKILAASLKLVASKGYAGTSISMICREAGLNASSLYWFFKNKEDLFLSAIRDAADDFLRVAQQPLSVKQGAPEDTLEQTFRVLAAQLEGNANFLRLLLIMMLEERDLPAEMRNRIAEIRALALSWWKKLLARYFENLGQTTAQLLAAEFAPLCRATVNGAFIAQQYGEPVDLDATLRQLFLLLSGLRDRIVAETGGTGGRGPSRAAPRRVARKR